MDNVSSRVKLMGNLQAAVAEAVSGTMEGTRARLCL